MVRMTVLKPPTLCLLLILLQCALAYIKKPQVVLDLVYLAVTIVTITSISINKKARWLEKTQGSMQDGDAWELEGAEELSDLRTTSMASPQQCVAMTSRGLAAHCASIMTPFWMSHLGKVTILTASCRHNALVNAAQQWPSKRIFFCIEFHIYCLNTGLTKLSRSTEDLRIQLFMFHSLSSNWSHYNS